MELGLEILHRESNDVGPGAFDLIDDEIPMVLGGVGASFVEGVDFRQIGVDLSQGEGFEGNSREFVENDRGGWIGAGEANAGADVMGMTDEAAEHEAGFVEVAGLSERLVIEVNEGVCTNDDGLRVFGAHGFGLGSGIPGGEISRGEGSWISSAGEGITSNW